MFAEQVSHRKWRSRGGFRPTMRIRLASSGEPQRLPSMPAGGAGGTRNIGDLVVHAEKPCEVANAQAE